jgi:hypothetical protein
MPTVKIHYWRQESFETLVCLQERFAEVAELNEYGEYLRLLENGLRDKALTHLQTLLQILRATSVPRRREIASLLLRTTEHETGHRLMPYPLLTGFIDPTLAEWRESAPNDPEPLRWSRSIDDLERALSIEPTCDYTRRKLVLRILGHVGFSTHGLPAGYIGEPRDDLGLIALARREASVLSDERARQAYLAMIDEEETEILNYLASRTASRP